MNTLIRILERSGVAARRCADRMVLDFIVYCDDENRVVVSLRPGIHAVIKACCRYSKWALNLAMRIKLELVWRHMPIDDERAQEALPF